MLLEVEKAIGIPFNKNVSFVGSGSLPQAAVIAHLSEVTRRFNAPNFFNGVPSGFTPYYGKLVRQPGLSLLSVKNGVIVHYAGAPVVMDGGNNVISDYSSNYARLLHFVDHDIQPMIEDAIEVDGRAVVITDDIRPLNYSHWLADGLPRLAMIGAEALRDDTYVVSTHKSASFQEETLVSCGFSPSRIIWLDDFKAVKARELLVPSDLGIPTHPAHRAAPWAIAYIQSTIGLESMRRSSRSGVRPDKIYLSRADASRRKIDNEDELVHALALLGYQRIISGTMTVAEQARSLSNASNVVGLHGAGMTNIIFSPPNCKILEILPQTYGTPAFYILAAGKMAPYATYIGSVDKPSSRPQSDNIIIDIKDFLDRCQHWL